MCSHRHACVVHRVLGKTDARTHNSSARVQCTASNHTSWRFASLRLAGIGSRRLPAAAARARPSNTTWASSRLLRSAPHVHKPHEMKRHGAQHAWHKKRQRACVRAGAQGGVSLAPGTRFGANLGVLASTATVDRPNQRHHYQDTLQCTAAIGEKAVQVEAAHVAGASPCV